MSFSPHPDLPPLPAISAGKLSADPRAAVKNILEDGQRWFARACELKCDALKICECRTLLIDEIIALLFDLAEKKYLAKVPRPRRRACVLALGGLGRREMGLFSDVDILILYEGQTDEYIQNITDALYYPLWDSKVEVGSTTRTRQECLAVGGQDLRTLTSLLDARYLSGDSTAARLFFTEIKNHFSNKKNLRRFISAKLAEQENRLRRFGDSISLVEPNVKEGEGGLRDYHTFLWTARAAHPQDRLPALFDRAGLSCEGQQELLEGVNFLWRIRHLLHLLEKGKNDRLGHGQQEPIARLLGFQKGLFSGTTEQLMQEYYRQASTVHLQSQRAVERIIEDHFQKYWLFRLFKRKRLAAGVYQVEGKILASKKAVSKGAISILKVFALAHNKKIVLTARTKENIMRFSDSIDVHSFNDKVVKGLWKKMLARPEFLHRVLEDILECRCLVRWFPEIKPIIHRIQHDGFHIYTVDEHSLKAVQEIGNLTEDTGKKTFAHPAEALRKVKNPHVLTLATLLHDVGKGHGPNHAEIGAEIGKEIAKRMGFEERESEAVAFLIKSHLLLPTLAYRRDIKDPQLICRLAETVKTPELLTMLYLLAFADVRSIGPGVWSDWKGGLLAELYQNTLAQLQEGGKEGERLKLIQKKIEKVDRLVKGAIPYETLSSFISSLPDRYLYAASPSTIASHLKMTSKLVTDPVILEVHTLPERGFTELSIVTRDSPGLFAKIAGVLSLNKVNIIDAQLYTLPDGTVLDLLWVTDFKHRPINDPAVLKDLQYELEAALTNAADIHKLIRRKSKRRFLTQKKPKHEPRIEIDNDVAVGETVVDVIAGDRPGLLYDIACTFFDLGCTIDRAKITTHIDQVIDVFYIRDAGGEKITSRERIKQIQEAIVKAVA